MDTLLLPLHKFDFFTIAHIALELHILYGTANYEAIDWYRWRWQRFTLLTRSKLRWRLCRKTSSRRCDNDGWPLQCMSDCTRRCLSTTYHRRELGYSFRAFATCAEIMDRYFRRCNITLGIVNTLTLRILIYLSCTEVNVDLLSILDLRTAFYHALQTYR